MSIGSDKSATGPRSATHDGEHRDVTTSLVYDSSARTALWSAEVAALTSYRGLLTLLVKRDLTVRYRRSVLGIWWALLNPMLLTGVLWLVFETVLHPFIPGDVPFLVYLFSGVTLYTFFSQGLLSGAAALSSNAQILNKIYVPPSVFLLSQAISALVNFLISLVVLALLIVVFGPGLPATFLLTPLVAVAVLLLVYGLAALLAPLVVRFNDAHSLLGILLVLFSYLTPQFWPVTIIPEEHRHLLWFNPLFSYLEVFRSLAYEGEFSRPLAWVIMLSTACFSYTAGALTLSQRWKNVAVAL